VSITKAEIGEHLYEHKVKPAKLAVTKSYSYPPCHRDPCVFESSFLQFSYFIKQLFYILGEMRKYEFGYSEELFRGFFFSFEVRANNSYSFLEPAQHIGAAKGCLGDYRTCRWVGLSCCS